MVLNFDFILVLILVLIVGFYFLLLIVGFGLLPGSASREGIKTQGSKKQKGAICRLYLWPVEIWVFVCVVVCWLSSRVRATPGATKQQTQAT